MPSNSVKLPFFKTWPLAVLSMELRKILSYRSDFWVQFLGGFFTEFFVAYCVWKAVYAAASMGVADASVITVKGITFDSMILFYVLAPLLTNIMHGQEMHFISRDIYDGSLSRYIVYPVPFLRFKYITHFSYGIVGIVQAILITSIYFFCFSTPAQATVTPWTVAAGLITSLLVGVLYFTLASAIEMVAFWADNVWSLMVMLKFIIRLLGGGMVPLAIYPEWAQSLLRYTPFYYLINFPIQTALGHVDLHAWALDISIATGWWVLFAGAAVLVWNRGSREYSGVGM